MMTKYPLRQTTTLVVVIGSLLLFSFARSPLPPPYYQYSIRGTLERPAGGSRENFAVVALGKFQIIADSGFQSFQSVSFPKYGDIPIALTDSAGVFFIRVSSTFNADSLRLAVVVPDMPLIQGVPFSSSGFQVIPNIESYELESQPGCSGCATDPTIEHRTTFYSYFIEDRTITIPF